MGNVRTSLIILTLFGLASCNQSHKIWDFKAYPEITWNELFEVDSEHYIVLVYSESCVFCDEVIKNITLPNKKSIKCLYTVLAGPDVPTFPNPENTIGATTIDNVWIYAVPTLIEITNKTVTNNVYGSDDVLSAISSFKI